MTIPAGSPLPRIGDAERDDAVRLLQEHLTAGRLDQDEFTERMNTALSARTQADLDPLFADLPGRRPGQRPAPAASRPATPPVATAPITRVPAQRHTGVIMIGLGVAVAVVLGLSAFGVQHMWWLLMIPVFLSVGSRCRPSGCGHRR